MAAAAEGSEANAAAWVIEVEKAPVIGDRTELLMAAAMDV